MSLIALGLCITFAVGGQTFYAGAWGVITAAWFAVAMWLWRQHVRYDDYIYAQERLKKGSGRAKRG